MKTIGGRKIGIHVKSKSRMNTENSTTQLDYLMLLFYLQENKH
jgi:hypothetical protein